MRRPVQITMLSAAVIACSALPSVAEQQGIYLLCDLHGRISGPLHLYVDIERRSIVMGDRNIRTDGQHDPLSPNFIWRIEIIPVLIHWYNYDPSGGGPADYYTLDRITGHYTYTGAGVEILSGICRRVERKPAF